MERKLIYFLLLAVTFCSCRATRETVRTGTEVKTIKRAEAKDSTVSMTDMHTSDSVRTAVFSCDSTVITQKDSTVVFVVTDSTGKELSRVVEHFFIRDRNHFLIAGNSKKESTSKVQTETIKNSHVNSQSIDNSFAMTHWNTVEREPKKNFFGRVGEWLKDILGLLGLVAIIVLCYLYKRGRIYDK